MEKIAQVDPDVLSNILREKLCDGNESKATWDQWAKSMVDSAKFVSSFSSLEDFQKFIDLFGEHKSTRAALPLYISQRIRGIGFALACDALKELGNLGYAKPDKHITDVCVQLNFCGSDSLSVFETIAAIAEACGETPYKVDKVLWLLCSGDFYKGYDYHSEPVEHRKRRKKPYIEAVKRELSLS